MKDFFYNLKTIFSIPVKNDERATNIIFVLCLISIIAFSIFIYRFFSRVYTKFDASFENNFNANLQIMRNEQSQYIQGLFNKL